MTTLFNTTFEGNHLYQKPITTGFHAIYVDGGTMEVNAASKNGGNYGCAISPLIYYKACGIQYCGVATKFRQRFYFHPNGLTMGDTRTLCLARNYHNDASRVFYEVRLRYASPNYQIYIGMSDNTGTITSNSGNTTISNAWHRIETYWQAGSPGSFHLWIDGADIVTLTQTNNNLRVLYAALGVAHYSNYALSGTFYIDDWKGNDDGSLIGA